MGIQVIAPGGYVREHSHTPNQEILFCFAGKGTVIRRVWIGSPRCGRRRSSNLAGCGRAVAALAVR
jgi:hypothetical protein